MPSPSPSLAEPRPAAGWDGQRRFLLATGTAHYHNEHLADLPTVAADVERVGTLFPARLGYQRVGGLELSPTAERLRLWLRDFARHPDRQPSDLVVFYYAGHGEVADDRRHLLLLPAEQTGQVLELDTETLARDLLSGTSLRRLLVILETCFAGQGADDFAVRAFTPLSRPITGQPDQPGVVLVTATRPKEVAKAGVFSPALVRAVDSLATVGYAPPYLDVEALVDAVNRDPEVPSSQRARLHKIALEGRTPPFLLNPRYDARLVEVDLLTQQQLLQWRRRAEELQAHFVPRARGVEQAGEAGWWFVGRHEALRRLAGWLDQPEHDPRVRVVTGDPGSGKSAVLARLVLLADPRYRNQVPRSGLPPATIPNPGVIDVAMHARGATTQDVLAALCAAADLPATDWLGELLSALASRDRPLVVLIDALDEATDPPQLAAELLRPLADATRTANLRLLLGTRRHLLDRLGKHLLVLDLDEPPYLELADLLGYARHGLLELAKDSPYRQASPRLVSGAAEAVAEAAGRSFLVARIVTRTLAATSMLPDTDDPTWRRSLPSTAGQAMRADLDQRLGEHARRARDLLLPLAYAQGAGLPWEDVWAPLASRLAGRPYSDDDVRWLREQAGSYVIEAVEQGRSAYRLYHQALVEHLRADQSPGQAHRVIARFLIERTPTLADGDRDWPRAHPYSCSHLAAHAGLAGLLDELLLDPRFLLAADPARLVSALERARGREAEAAAEAYRHVVRHLGTKPASEHAAYLELAARCYGATRLAQSINERSLPRPWSARIASWDSQVAHRVFTGHTGPVRVLAISELNDYPVALSAGSDATLRLWDLTTGSPVGQPLSGHTGPVRALAVHELDGRPTAVSASDDHTLRVWDLASGRSLQLAGHKSPVTAVVVAELDDRPVAISASDDKTLRLWDLHTGHPVGQPLTGHSGHVTAVALGDLNGPIAVSASDDHTLRVWDLASGRSLHQLAGHEGPVTAVAVVELEGRPITVSASADYTLRTWDLTTGALISQLRGHSDWVNAIAIGQRYSRPPIAVSASDDMTLWVWDLAAGAAIGQFTGHYDWVNAVAIGDLDGRPIAVSASDDHTLRIWDLTIGTPLGRLTGHTRPVRTLAIHELDGRPIAVSASDDHTLRVWDMTSRVPAEQPFTGHAGPVNAVAIGELDGRPIAVSVGDDHTQRRWDLTTGTQRGQLHTGHTGPVNAVALGELGGQPIAVSAGSDGTLWVWNLADARPVYLCSGHTGEVRAVAVGELEGRPIAVSACDWSLWVWDLAGGALVGRLVTDHVGLINGLAVGKLNDRPLAISAAGSGYLAAWDLTTGQLAHLSARRPHGVNDMAVGRLNDRPIAVTAGSGGFLDLWDLATGRSKDLKSFAPSDDMIRGCPGSMAG